LALPRSFPSWPLNLEAWLAAFCRVAGGLTFASNIFAVLASQSQTVALLQQKLTAAGGEIWGVRRQIPYIQGEMAVYPWP